MIVLGEELDLALRMKQLGSASRSLLSTISQSRINYWAAYAVDFSCILLFAYLGLRHHPGWISNVGNFAFGVAVFTLIEYSIHRWLLHNPNTFFFPLHEAHHNHPEETAAFLFPTTFVVLMPIWLLFVDGMHWQGGSLFLCGITAGYFYFDTLHHFEHTVRINQIPFRWLQGRWAAHSVHHKLDETNYGVMTSFWDYVFGTHQKQIKRKSQRA
jgi:sterol desaturase/sphingolipid hydroxylase (fatty acid hydroxylase superfamily)